MSASRPEDDASFFEALMESAVDGIIIIDHHGLIQRFNRSAQTLFGYSEEEVVKRNLNLLMPEPMRSQHDGYLKRYMDTGEAAIIGIGREVTGLRKSGDVFPMRLSVGESRQNGSIQFVGIVHDLSRHAATEEKIRILEQQLFHADRLLTLGELTASIAHEINQPLTAIAAFADAARQLIDSEPDSVDASVNHICTRISEQSRRAAEVVVRLRKLVRTGSATRSAHDIRNIVDNMLVLFDYELKKTGVILRVHGPEIPTNVFVDEIQIQQILVNLVKNSLDAIAESGLHDGKIDINICTDQTDLTVSIADNGPGVSAESEAQLFAPFYTSKPNGVGVGLSICKHIASAHGGSLSYVVAKEPGARFTLKLPLSSIG